MVHDLDFQTEFLNKMVPTSTHSRHSKTKSQPFRLAFCFACADPARREKRRHDGAEPGSRDFSAEKYP